MRPFHINCRSGCFQLTDNVHQAVDVGLQQKLLLRSFLGVGGKSQLMVHRLFFIEMELQQDFWLGWKGM